MLILTALLKLEVLYKLFLYKISFLRKIIYIVLPFIILVSKKHDLFLEDYPISCAKEMANKYGYLLTKTMHICKIYSIFLVKETVSMIVQELYSPPLYRILFTHLGRAVVHSIYF